MRSSGGARLSSTPSATSSADDDHLGAQVAHSTVPAARRELIGQPHASCRRDRVAVQASFSYFFARLLVEQDTSFLSSDSARFASPSVHFVVFLALSQKVAADRSRHQALSRSRPPSRSRRSWCVVPRSRPRFPSKVLVPVSHHQQFGNQTAAFFFCASSTSAPPGQAPSIAADVEQEEGENTSAQRASAGRSARTLSASGTISLARRPTHARGPRLPASRQSPRTIPFVQQRPELLQ